MVCIYFFPFRCWPCCLRGRSDGCGVFVLASDDASKDATTPEKDMSKGGDDDAPAMPQIVNVISPTPASEPSNEISTVQEGQNLARPRCESSASGSRPASWWDYTGWSGSERPLDGQEKPSEDSKGFKDTKDASPDAAKEDVPTRTEAQEAQMGGNARAQQPLTLIYGLE